MALDPGPYTPMEQTVSTPIDAPQHEPSYFKAGPYANPHYNESDDVLTDIDEPVGQKITKHYSLTFTSIFDQLVMAVYSHILSLPTTTPFSGIIPPSGLVSKVANETMNNLMASVNTAGSPLYDLQSIINYDYLRNHSYQPIFLQLIRKRFLDLCSYTSKQDSKLPQSTSISITMGGGAGGSMSNGNDANSFYSNNFRQSSISNLSLTDANVSSYNANGPQRSRSSSLNLRKQSLTRNNSYSGNNWLHVGNLNNIRPGNNANGANPGGFTLHNDKFNGSTDSLQSMQDFVPQSFIQRSAGTASSSNQSLISSQGGQGSANFNAMMMDYQTPPASGKGSISMPSKTPPSLSTASMNTLQPHHPSSFLSNSDSDDLNFFKSRPISRSSSRAGSSSNIHHGNQFPRPLTINIDAANQPINGFGNSTVLDSPFMSATTPSEEYGYFMNSFQPAAGSTSSASSVCSGNIPESPQESLQDDSNRINLPSQFSLSEKKRDSLKLKRGIH